METYLHDADGDRGYLRFRALSQDGRSRRVNKETKKICELTERLIKEVLPLILRTTTRRKKTMRMLNPPRPGTFIRTEVIKPLNLSVSAAATVLGVSRPTLSTFLNGHSDLSGTMALRIEKAFGVKMDMTRPRFCTKRCERVYMTACGCETSLGGENGLPTPGAGGL